LGILGLLLGALGCVAAFTGVFGVALWWSWGLLGGLGGSWVLSWERIWSSGVVVGVSLGGSWMTLGTSFVFFVVKCKYCVLAEKDLLALPFYWKSCYL
jgi:hypothetical protein